MVIDSRHRETVQYHWDAVGRLAEVADPEGAVTAFQYDAAGNRQYKKFANGGQESYGYDALNGSRRWTIRRGGTSSTDMTRWGTGRGCSTVEAGSPATPGSLPR